MACIRCDIDGQTSNRERGLPTAFMINNGISRCLQVFLGFDLRFGAVCCVLLVFELCQ
jgi:hypothetical protein